MGKPSQPQLHPWIEPATASTLITNGQSGSVSFDVTADVQAFLSGTTNDGWIIKKDVEGDAGLLQFASRQTGSGPRLSLTVQSSDTTPPTAVSGIAGSFDSQAGTLAVTWNASSDPTNADGSAGSGVSGYRYRYQLNGADWTTWAITAATSVTISPVSVGDIVNIEVTATDAAGNVSQATSDSMTLVTDGSAATNFTNPPTLDLTQPYALPTLTSAQVSQATAAVQGDASVQALLSGHSYAVTAVDAMGKETHAGLVGADVTLTLDQPATLNGQWPEMIFTDDNSSPPYVTDTVPLAAANVSSVDAFVDLATNVVIGLEPDVGAQWAQPSPLTYHNASQVKTLPRTLPNSAATASTVLSTLSQPEEDTSDFGTGRASNNALHLVCPDHYNCFWNFDFEKNAMDDNTVGWNRVDMPITMLWTGNANINSVKNYIHTSPYLLLTSSGSSMAASLAEHTGTGFLNWSWDTDKGVKGDKCSPGFLKTPHSRLYANPQSDFFFSPQFGFYILGSTHYDWGECESFLVGGPINWAFGTHTHWGHSGYSEKVERYIANQVAADHSSGIEHSVSIDSIPLRNAEHFKTVEHVFDNDGIATKIVFNFCFCE